MKSFQKIHDLTRRRGAAPLVIPRLRVERQHRNLLTLEKSQPTRRAEFDLQRKKNPGESNGIFVLQRRLMLFRFSRLKIAASALILVLVLNLVGVFSAGKATLEHAVSSAFSGLATLTEASKSFAAGEFTASTDKFTEATQAFQSAEKDLLVLGGAGAVLATKPENVQAGSQLVTAGKLLAEAGQNFAAAANVFTEALPTWFTRQEAVSRGEKNVISFAAELRQATARLTEGFIFLNSAADVLAKVNISALPTDLQSKVSAACTSINLITTIAEPYLAALPHLPELLGERVPRKYLVLFQNPDEIRPTGGFIGSFAEVTVNKGFVEKFRIRDVYSVDGQLAQRFSPPEGFGFITNEWGLRDSNYHPDFPTSAASAAYLYEEAGEGSVDGIFAVTSNLLTELVELTGGTIRLPRFKEPIPTEDLNLLLSLIIEAKTDGAANPKQILSEVWQALRPKLAAIPREKFLAALYQATRTKELQFWTAGTELEKVPTAFQIDGALKQIDDDYLFVVDTSLSGNKSDRYTANLLTHVADIAANGEVTNTLTITRTHGWNAAEEARIDRLARDYGVTVPDYLKEILGRGRNVDLVKVFVPEGAELVSAEGIALNQIETHISAGKTYFLFTLTTQPKSASTVRLTYRLSGRFKQSYRLLVEKQAGEQVALVAVKVKRSGKEVFNGELELSKNQEIEVNF